MKDMKHFSFKRWFKIHNRTLAGCVAIIIFSAIMISVIIFTIDSGPHLCEVCPKREKKSVSTYDSFCSANGCNITCKSLDETKVEELINAAIPPNCPDISVLLMNTNFAFQTIKKMWLNSIKVNIKILKFHECPFSTIEIGAFKAKCFNGLTDLTITDGRIQHLKAQTLSDLVSLQTLTIKFQYRNTINHFQADPGVFKGLNSLTTIKMNNFLTDQKQVKNLFGDGNENLASVRNIDLSSNDIKYLDGYNFKNVDGLENLILAKNDLKLIDVTAFHPLRLKRLDLSENKIKTLSNGIFDFANFEANGLLAGDNYWKCNCDLYWFKVFTLSTNFVSKESPPLCGKINFEDVNFGECPEVIITTTSKKPTTKTPTTTTKLATTTTETPTTTTKLPTTTTETPSTTTKLPTTTTEKPTTTENITTITKLPTTTTIATTLSKATTNLQESEVTTVDPLEHYVPVRCKFPRSDSENFFQQNHPVINLSDIHIQIQFSFENTKLHIKFDGDITDYSLLGFESANRYNMDCFTGLHNHVVLEQLELNTDYTFCITKNESKVSPFSCFGLKTGLDYEHSAWIMNEDRIIIIPAAILVFALSMVLCGLLVFFCVRQHPHLIKGNKRVIIVGSKGTDAMIMPKDFERREAAYVQPIYDKIKPRPSVRSRSMSVGSAMSYINAEPPTRKSTWKEAKSDRIDNLNCYEVVNLPPPLPPCHPAEQNIYEDTYLKAID